MEISINPSRNHKAMLLIQCGDEVRAWAQTGPEHGASGTPAPAALASVLFKRRCLAGRWRVTTGCGALDTTTKRRQLSAHVTQCRTFASCRGGFQGDTHTPPAGPREAKLAGVTSRAWRGRSARLSYVEP